jgi:hypothetical protein
VLDEAIAEVEKHRDEVVLYSGYKETKIDLLPQRQADLKAEQEALDRLREQVDQNAARHQGELDRLNIQLGKLEKDRERARADAATIDIFGRSGITLHSQGALAAATLAATEPGPFEYGRLDGIWKRIEAPMRPRGTTPRRAGFPPSRSSGSSSTPTLASPTCSVSRRRTKPSTGSTSPT